MDFIYFIQDYYWGIIAVALLVGSLWTKDKVARSTLIGFAIFSVLALIGIFPDPNMR